MPEDESSEAPWDSTVVPGGDMFQGEEDFSAYVRNAEIIGNGLLTEWDGRRGVARVESLLAGSLPDNGTTSVPLVYSGGFVHAETGQKVLFLLSHKKGELRLHSFCPASGLFPHSDRLEALASRSIAAQRASAQR